MTTAFSLSHVSKQFKGELALTTCRSRRNRGASWPCWGRTAPGRRRQFAFCWGCSNPTRAGEVSGLDSRKQGIEIRRRVGYVPDQPALYDWMTVEEAGWFVAGFYPLGFQRHYNELIEHFELPPDRKIKELSKGMRAKVSLSLAMGHKPELLILDEPTSGLDPLVRREFLESMVDIAGQGRTVLLASHQIAEVERVADVVAILRDGKLALVERLDELKTHVCELTITLRNGSPNLPTVPGTVLHREFKGRQWRLLVRNIDEPRLAQFRTESEVGNVEMRHPSLEEIFVGYMKSGLLCRSKKDRCRYEPHCRRTHLLERAACTAGHVARSNGPHDRHPGAAHGVRAFRTGMPPRFGRDLRFDFSHGLPWGRVLCDRQRGGLLYRRNGRQHGRALADGADDPRRKHSRANGDCGLAERGRSVCGSRRCRGDVVRHCVACHSRQQWLESRPGAERSEYQTTCCRPSGSRYSPPLCFSHFVLCFLCYCPMG